ncbi:hypothetical protein GCM10007216_32620 [Thalassobacillus devorans]|uniref:DUF5392 family protein n=1 Tax=Thalassobacillus devorans TaxID=279813 RepID=A0ABQ1PLJ4_9BACI|nr:DUF5392 family protein [Thalassobacillus devorans]NIK30222.1 hypothetical protein [Thalassobacillus devorans]GGC99317.1 hypothetical protein GCM10007216_32620 [Thalassobacillus devorans]
MNFSMTDMPNSVKQEVEELERNLSPVTKKAAKYVFLSFPLIAISVVNLLTVLFMLPDEQVNWISVGIYALIGAVGMALSKEAKHKQIEIQERSVSYIVERIRRSDVATEQAKKDYTDQVKSQPINAMKHFVAFLEEEKRQEKLNLYRGF